MTRALTPNKFKVRAGVSLQRLWEGYAALSKKSVLPPHDYRVYIRPRHSSKRTSNRLMYQ